MALNSIQAFKSGATWVDGTIQGMGRGKCKTENLLNYFKKFSYNPKSIEQLQNIISEFEKYNGENQIITKLLQNLIYIQLIFKCYKLMEDILKEKLSVRLIH